MDVVYDKGNAICIIITLVVCFSVVYRIAKWLHNVQQLMITSIVVRRL